MTLDDTPPLPIKPLQAWRALMALRRNNEDTAQVFLLTQALSGRRPIELRARFLSHPLGIQRLTERRSLLTTLTRTDWLAQLPVGSFGRVYHDFLAEQGLTAQGLVDLSRETFGHMQDDGSDRYYIGQRLRDMHDLFHVLSGFGRDALGEVCVLSFSYPHQRTRSYGVIGAAGALELLRRYRHMGILRSVIQAYKLGKQCEWLLVQDIESLLTRNLHEVRKSLGIAAPTHYLATLEDLRQRGHDIPTPPGLHTP